MSDEIDVPARLRALRATFKLTQRDLARRTGLSHTTIAKIERGEISPTIASLQKIAASFQLPVTSLIDASADEPTRIFYKHEDLTVVALGKHTIRQIGRNLSRRALQMMEDTYEPGADTGDAMLSHAGEEAGLVIRGHLEVTVGDQVAVLGPGEAYFFESRIPHRFRNRGNETCVVVAAATPPSL
ncbi:helix-turn-helix family protein [Burkholderia thailandensis MSMB121]|uniref:cupin domain-containing protein n=1 Tax=Burkholderia TaxID=32008 RepID=UPI000327FC5E|nr:MULTISPECIES: cupin domain-containing protein [Burkholderia]AGK51249.1 helix-turn-helix family protein [Burkholderia thailandensis MSMB121]ATF33582.1 XRE family transcriptional regulator [Burkholderia thailandensis]KST71655.1 XRE family transcriptional regulator [Burkholderia humptydooensis]